MIAGYIAQCAATPNEQTIIMIIFMGSYQCSNVNIHINYCSILFLHYYSWYFADYLESIAVIKLLEQLVALSSYND